jgi:hypothetical protein
MENEQRIINCGHCGENEYVAPERTTLFEYTRDRAKTHLKIGCFALEDRVSIEFVDWQDEKEMEWARQFPTVVEESCEDEQLIAVWKHKFDIKAINEYDLTGSQRKKCDFLKYLLEVTPDNEIQAEFAQPQPPRLLGWRWK